MNKSRLLVIFTSLITMPAFSATINNFRYLDVAYIDIDGDSSSDADGFEIKASHDIDDYIYLSGTYQDYSFTDEDYTRWLAGLGGKYQISEQFIPYIQAEYVDLSGDSLGVSFDFNYRIYSLGFAGTINNFGYKAALIHYDSSDIPDENGYYAELFYSLNKNISLGLKVEHVNNGGELKSFTFRYHY